MTNTEVSSENHEEDMDSTPDEDEVPLVRMSWSEKEGIKVEVLTRDSSQACITEMAALIRFIRKKISLADLASVVRRRCNLHKDYFIFTEEDTSKMESLLTSVVANYPSSLKFDNIETHYGIKPKAARAYATSSNNWTSEYMHIDEEGLQANEKGIREIAQRISSRKRNGIKLV